MSDLTIEETDGSVIFAVRVSPRASRDAIGGVHDGALKVKLTAPPVDGAANAALIKLLSKKLGVAKGAVTIIAGDTSRTKRVRIEGVTVTAARALAG